MKPPRPSDLELQVLTVLWDRGPSAIREILEAIPDGKPRAYTTILSVVQVMEKKGLVGHRQKGQAHIYHARVKRQNVVQPMLREMVRNVLGGSPAQALQHLLQSTRIDEEELALIRELIDRATDRPQGDEP